jgi:hypothetical protein
MAEHLLFHFTVIIKTLLQENVICWVPLNMEARWVPFVEYVTLWAHSVGSMRLQCLMVENMWMQHGVLNMMYMHDVEMSHA